MASLQARHSRTCASGRPWTPLAALDGCDCGPTFYVVVREGAKVNRERVGKNPRDATRALTKIQSEEDEGQFVAVRPIRFAAWAEQYLAGLELESSTVRSYRATMDYAKRAFGSKPVRRLQAADVKRFLVLMREAGASDSTRRKHLRVLGACLNSAIVAGYANRNPVKALPKGEKPRARKREAAYFANEELPRLCAELEEPYRTLCLLALKSGARLGELSALRWADVDLVGAVLHVRRSWTDGRLVSPKNHERRDLDLAPEVVELLGAWWGQEGAPDDEALVFPGSGKGGYLDPQAVLRRALYPALKRAGIPREGPSGEKRTFHSFRHTFAKCALENGRPVTWLSRHLGHSSLAITSEVYGHWERAARRREARAMEGVFAV
jgi:integrase